VIQSASRSSGEILSRTSLCSLRKGLRRLMTASTDGGCNDVAGDVVLMPEIPSEKYDDHRLLCASEREEGWRLDLVS
jgi:hypothetical protein